MSGVGILFHVVSHANRGKHLLQLIGDAMVEAILGAIAADNRTRGCEKGLGVFRQRAAIVDARRRESAAGASNRAKPPPMQKPITPTLPVPDRA